MSHHPSKSVNEQLPDFWVRKESTSHHGLVYYFNTKTGESLWDSPSKLTDLQIEDQIIKNKSSYGLKKAHDNNCNKYAVRQSLDSNGNQNLLKINSSSNGIVKKNLAQDRLRKLQQTFTAEMVETQLKPTKVPREKKEDVVPVQIKEPNRRKLIVPEEKVGANSDANRIIPTKLISAKRKAEEMTPTQTEDHHGHGRKKSVNDRMVKLRHETTKPAEKYVKPNPPKVVARAVVQIEAKNLPVPKAIDKTTQIIPAQKPVITAASPNNRLNILHNKHVAPQVPQPLKTQKVEVENETNSRVRFTNALNPSKMTVVPEKHINVATKTVPPNRVEAEKKSGNRFVNSFFNALNSAANSVIKIFQEDKKEVPPVIERSKSHAQPANDRLNRMRMTINAAKTEELEDYDVIMEDLNSSKDLGESKTSLDESESMDWEDIPEETALREVNNLRQSNHPDRNASIHFDTTIPSFENEVLRGDGNVEKYFFIVIDTNIFLSNMKYVETLPDKIFKHAGQPILIVPYIVLTELDNIKHRTRDKIASAAIYSVKYLNRMFKNKDGRIKGQSAMNARNKLIEIDNPDDNIINCCLQLQIATRDTSIGLILLSNDNNLRNKAFVNDIETFSCIELMYECDTIRFDQRRS